MGARQPQDIYDKHAVKLMEMGYHPVPVAPLGYADKRPMRYDPHTGQFFGFTGWTTSPPVIDPQPGANIGALMGKSIVGLDYDHDDAALIICEVFPPAPVCKVGERGWTAFYRIDFDVPSEDFYNSDGELVLQILSGGKQTVIPPSIHPKTLQPYRWTNGHSLYDTPVEELPLLPRDYRERVLKLGFNTTRLGREHTKHDKRVNSVRGEPDGPFAELNQMAIRDLAKWVPQLNIYKLRRRVGRFANYEGVAQWRESTTGKTLEERELNLKISGRGIKDFGDGRGYSAIDLVVAARGTGEWEAYWWLDEHMRPKSSISDADIDKLVETANAPPIAPEVDTNKEAKKTESLVGDFWYPTDPAPSRPEMLVDRLVPDVRRYGILRGQMGAMKTFILNNLAVAIASGTPFGGLPVARRGLVLQGEFDGSYSEVRLWAAMDAAGVDRNQPVVLFKKVPPTVLASKRVNPVWRKWRAEFCDRVQAAEDKYGLPLTFLTMDPVNRFGGFDDENSSAEGNAFGKEMDALCEELGCTALISDHLGKDPEKGTRGTTAKEQNAFYVLDAGETAKAIDETRILKIVRIKEDASGVGLNFHMESVPVTYPFIKSDGSLGQDDRTTLIPRWDDGGLKSVSDLVSPGARRDDLTENEKLALNKLIGLINKKGEELPTSCGMPPGSRGVALEDWFLWLSRSKQIDASRGQARAVFGRMCTRLQNRRAIAVMDGWVWIPLPTTEE